MGPYVAASGVRNRTRLYAAAVKVTIQSTSSPPRMTQLSQEADRLHQAEDLLDELPLALADPIARVTRGAIIDGGEPHLARDIRGEPARPDGVHEARDIVVLDSAHRAAPADRLESYGEKAVLAYLGHVLLDNRHGLVANACATAATGTAEPDTACAVTLWRKMKRYGLGGAAPAASAS